MYLTAVETPVPARRPTTAFIDLEALRFNYTQLKARIAKGVKVLAMVKANAYGHGAVEVTRTLEGMGCDMFGVALCEEGIELREAGIKAPILVMGGVYKGQIGSLIAFNLTPVVFDIDTATAIDEALRASGKKLPIHVKIDTGMGRLGLLPHQVAQSFRQLKGLKNLEVEGLLTHLAEADEEDKGFSREQLETFLRVMEVVNGLGFNPPLKHIANSAAIVDYPPSHFNLVRPGIMLYGSYPSRGFKDKIMLRPVMRLVTRIIQLKRVESGFSISYGRTYITEKETTIATIPIGYGDGYPRRLSGLGEVLVRGKRAPIVGAICMDLTMLDVTHIEGVSIGDEVVIIGRCGMDDITVEEVAERSGTIPYEILCGIGNRVPREYHEGVL